MCCYAYSCTLQDEESGGNPSQVATESNNASGKQKDNYKSVQLRNVEGNLIDVSTTCGVARARFSLAISLLAPVGELDERDVLLNTCLDRMIVTTHEERCAQSAAH